MKSLKSNKSFTLIEILVTAALFTIIMAMVFASFYAANYVSFTSADAVGLQQQARQVVDGISREIRQCRAVDVTLPASNRIQVILGGEIILYYNTTNNQILREYPAGVTVAVANDVSYLNFNQTGQCFTIKVRGAKNSHNRVLTYNLTEEVWTRNNL